MGTRHRTLLSGLLWRPRSAYTDSNHPPSRDGMTGVDDRAKRITVSS